MATDFSALVAATQAKPYILTHCGTGERYAYSAKRLEETRQMYAERGLALNHFYTINNEWAEEGCDD